MSWLYLGIDGRPPKRVPLFLLLEDGTTVVGTSAHPSLIAWLPVPPIDKMKTRCQYILRGLVDELAMVSCIMANPITRIELNTALDNYWDEELASFVDLIRVLDRKAHNGVACLPNHHR